MLSARTAYRISLVGAVVVLGIVAVAAMLRPASPCGDLAAGYDPLLAFEMARSVNDLQALFGSTSDVCRATIRMRMDSTNFIDGIAYIPAYTAFLLFALLGLREGSKGVARAMASLGAALALAVAAADYVENAGLFKLSDEPDVMTIWVTVLIVATNLKWMGLGIATALGGAVLWTRGGLARVAIVPCLLGLVTAVGAIADPAVAGPWLTKSLTIAWLPLLVVAMAGAFAKPSEPFTA